MVTKKQKIKKLNELYDELREQTCYKYSIVNVGKVKSYADELSALEEYLPNLMPSFIIQNYTSLNEKGVWDDIVKKTGETRHYTMEECVYEFVDWVDEHPQFKEVLDKESLKELEKELGVLEKELERSLKCLT